MLQRVEVVAGILYDGAKLLIAQRREEKFCHKWEFPGGKTEQGETPELALHRELKEELNVETSGFEHFCDSEVQIGHKLISLTTFKVESFSGDLEMNVHQDLRWVLPAELADFEFLEADIPVVEKLRLKLK